LLEIGLADGISQVAVVALELERCGCADGRIERQVIGFAIGWASLDVASALAVGAGAAAAASLATGQLIEGGIQAARNLKFLARLGLLAAFPPVCILVLKDILARGLGRVRVWVFLGNLVVYFCAIFFFTSSELLSDSSSVISA
jgi:hypothetical protein